LSYRFVVNFILNRVFQSKSACRDRNTNAAVTKELTNLFILHPLFSFIFCFLFYKLYTCVYIAYIYALSPLRRISVIAPDIHFQSFHSFRSSLSIMACFFVRFVRRQLYSLGFQKVNNFKFSSTHIQSVLLLWYSTIEGVN